MGKASKEKGKRGERELSHHLSGVFGIEARRGVQYQGGDDSPDVVGLPGVHVEAKRVESLRLWPSIDQAVGDAAPGRVPVVFHRPNGRDWVAIVYVADIPNLVEALRDLRGPEASPRTGEVKA